MGIMELGAIGELVGGVAVIASLIYVGIQVRQNTSTMRSSTSQAFSSAAGAYANFVAGNSECLRTFRLGLDAPESLGDEDERMRFGLMINSMFRTMESAFFQFRSGFIGVEEWKGMFFSLSQVTQLPGFRTFWAARREAFSTAFAELIDAEIARTSETTSKASSMFLDDKSERS